MIANPRRIVLGALGFSVSGILALLLALSLFAYPSADDFCLAVRASQLGFREAQGYWYNNWTGRFFSTAVISAFVAGRDIVGIYWLAAILVLLLTLASFVILVWSIAHERHSWLQDPASQCDSDRALRGDHAGSCANVLLVDRQLHLPARQRLLRRARCAADLARDGRICEEQPARTHRSIACGRRRDRLERSFVAADVDHAVGRHSGCIPNPSSLAIRVGSFACRRLGRSARQRHGTRQRDTRCQHGRGRAASPRSMGRGACLSTMDSVARAVLAVGYRNVGVGAHPALDDGTFKPELLYSNGKFDKRFLAVPIAWVALMFLLSLIGFVINRYPLPERAESVVALVFLLGWFPSFIVLAHYLLGRQAGSGRRSTCRDRRCSSLHRAAGLAQHLRGVQGCLSRIPLRRGDAGALQDVASEAGPSGQRGGCCQHLEAAAHAVRDGLRDRSAGHQERVRRRILRRQIDHARRTCEMTQRRGRRNGMHPEAVQSTRHRPWPFAFPRARHHDRPDDAAGDRLRAR